MSEKLLYRFGFNPSDLWIDSYLRCTACGNHILCKAHAQALELEFRKAKQALVQKNKCEHGFC